MMRNEIGTAKKDKRITLVSLLLLLLLLAIFLFHYQCDRSENRDIKLEGTAIEMEEPIVQNGIVMTEIPGYSDKILSKREREFKLVNPKHNQVLFKYIIVCNNKEIHETDYIVPGNMVKVDLYDLLEQGKYDVILKLETRDIKSDQTCNSANVHLNLTVEK